MSVTEFKKLFNEIATSEQWQKICDGWLNQERETDECTVFINLEKSNYGKLYYVGIGVFVRNAFGHSLDSTDMREFKQPTLYRRHPTELDPVFDLRNELSSQSRREGVLDFFKFMTPFADRARTVLGITELSKDGLLFIAPGVKQELERLMLAVDNDRNRPSR